MASVTIRKEQGDAGKNLLKALKQLENKEVKIGWFPSAQYDNPERTPVAAVAAQNEYGNPSKRIPARPFIRPAIIRDSRKWLDLGESGVKAVLDGKTTINHVLEAIGQTVRADIQSSIARVYTPVLKQRTIEARLARRSSTGRLNKIQAQSISKPLIDTGHMQATVSYEISSAS